MTITRYYHFYAAHRNVGIGGKCARLHGHRYGVEVTLAPPYSSDGVSVAFEDIDAVIAPIIKTFDHRTLLDDRDALMQVDVIARDAVVVPFPTSAENMAGHILNLCRESSLGDSVIAVTVQETDSAKVTVTVPPKGEPPRYPCR